jgi:hypothetical protein
MTSEMCTALPSWVTITEIPRLRLPLVRVIDVAGASCWATLATSPRRTAAVRPGAAGAAAAEDGGGFGAADPLGAADGACDAGGVAGGVACADGLDVFRYRLRIWAMVTSGAPTCTVSDCWPTAREPAGVATPLPRSASTIEVTSTPAAASLARSGVMTTCRLLAPVTSAARTPSIFWISGTTVLASRSANSRSSADEPAARTTMGTLLVLPENTACVVPAGNRGPTASSAAFSLDTVSSRLVP